MDNVATNHQWYVYIIKTSDNQLYTGITTDVERRWQEHTSSNKGAKYFRGRNPKALLFVCFVGNRSLASQKEIVIKKLTRKQKLILIDSVDNQLIQYKQSIAIHQFT